MERKLKTIADAGDAVLKRSGEGTAKKESERIVSISERIFLRDRQEKGLEIQKNHLDVWLVENEFHSEADNGWKERLRQEKEKLGELEREHNKGIAQEGDSHDLREYRFQFKLYNEMAKGLRETYDNLEHVQEIPEIIVTCSADNENGINWIEVPNRVGKAVDKLMDNIFRYQNEVIPSHLAESLYAPTATKFDFEKNSLSQDSLIEYGLSHLELMQHGRQQELFSRYISDKDEQHILEFFSNDVLRKIYEKMCVVDEEYIDGFMWEYEGSDDVTTEFYYEFRVDVDHEKIKKQREAEFAADKEAGQINEDEDFDYDRDWRDYEEVSAAVGNYWTYRKSLSEAAKEMDFESVKEKMLEYYVGRVKDVLDGYAQEFVRESEAFEAEKQLLKPVLVHVSSDPVSREVMRYQGAEIVLDALSAEEMGELIDFTSRMKGSAASIMPEKLRRNKAEFYKSVEEKLDARSEITADTKREVEILQDIFQRAGEINTVLDVGCGNGRIDMPLLEKGYKVYGIDANEQFLQSALKKAIEKKLEGARFLKGDVIDYRNDIEHGSCDSVIYTWHSILEAFGLGNLMHTLGCAYHVLKPGGVLVFDQPTRENPHMEDGWYGNNPDSEHQYLSYIMTEEEIKFVLKMAGFENVEILKWKTKSSEEYPEGMEKYTVSAKKPQISEEVFKKMSGFLKFRKENDEYNRQMEKRYNIAA